MEQEGPRLAEALTEEQVWEDDGAAVLRVGISLPQLAGDGGRTRRFNRYYRRLCRAYLAFCRHVLLPEAAEACRAARAVSAPWEPGRAELRHRVTLCTGELLSVVCDARERCGDLPPALLRRAEVWDLSAGLPVPPGEFFPPHVNVKRTLLRFAREETLRRIERGGVCRGNWRAALRRTLDPRNYCLTERGLCFFCPTDAAAGAKEGIVTFTMPWDAEAGPFLPPER